MQEILQASRIYGQYLLENHPFIHSSIPLITQKSINKNTRDLLPTEFDSRKQWPGKINKNGNQFGSGCCYLFGCLYAFSDRYAIFKNQDYIRMSVVEIAAIERTFTPDGNMSTNTDKERSGKKGCINCDPFQNGMGSDILQAINVYGTVSEIGKENDANFSFAKFCKSYSNCSCPPNSPDSYCDDDSWKNYQTDLSKKLPSDISIYDNVEKYPTNDEKKNMIINDISPDNYNFTSLAQEIMTNGPVGISYFFGSDFTRDNYNETGGIYMCTDWQDNSNPFGYRAAGKSGSGGHYISIIGFGSQQISYKYKGKQENELIHYYLCRNSWGDNHGFFKAASAQIAGGIKLMSGVWGICSFITFVSPPTFKCVNGVCISCDKGENGCSEKNICDESCIVVKDTYKCDGQNCIKCGSGETCRYIDSNCKDECQPPLTYKCDGQNCIKCGIGETCQYLDSNCQGECQPPPLTYKCDGQNCIKCGIGETCQYLEGNCNGECQSPLSTYKCDGQNCIKCGIGETCQYLDSNCKGECQLPPIIKGTRCNFSTGKYEDCIVGKDINCGIYSPCEKLYSGNTCTPCTYSSIGCTSNKNCEKQDNKIRTILFFAIIIVIILMVMAIFLIIKPRVEKLM